MPPNSVSVSFGSWLQIRRRWLQLSQAQLGARVNYSAIAIRKLESGTRRCSDELARLLAAALEIPVQHHPAFTISARTGILESGLLTLVPSAASAADQSDQDNQLDPPDLTDPERRTRLEWTHLAQPTADIFGRASEIEQLLARLRDPSTQLMTLVGAPGVGKTRLALEVLNRADEADWPDGKFFVPLAHIDHVSLIPEAIAAAMGIREANARQWRDTVASQNVFQFVKGKRVLLVLDNFEHLSEGVLFVSALLAAAPMVKVLVTSRGSLNLMAEQEYQVPPLAVPARTADLTDAAGNGAVQLLVARAQSRQPTFQLTSGNLKSIVALCQLLDGLPLALELAAVRLRTLSPQVLLAQLNESAQISNSISRGAAGVEGPAFAPGNSPPYNGNAKGNSRKLLNKPTSDMPVRHRSLAEALTWSYNLLTPSAQHMFDQLGVFQGGFTREAALAVTQGSLEDLDDLAGQSLIQIQDYSHDLGRGIRLSLLETFRAFALGKLDGRGETDAVRSRHARYLAALLQRWDNNSPGPNEVDGVDTIHTEIANMRAALSWCLKHDLPTGFTLGRYLSYYWVVNGNLYEGRAWITQMLQADEQTPTVVPEARAYLLCAGALLYSRIPLTVIEDQLRLFRQLNLNYGIAMAEAILGWMRLRSAPVKASQHFDSAIAVLEAEGRQKTWLSAHIHTFQGVVMGIRGSFNASEDYFNKAMQLYTQLHDRRELAHTQNYIAWLHFARGDYDKAAELAQAALLLSRQVNDAYARGRACATKAFAEIELRRWTHARISVDEGLQVVNEAGVETLKALLLHAAGALAFAQGTWVDARALYRESLIAAQLLDQVDYIPLTLINLAQLEIGEAPSDVTPMVQWLNAVTVNARRVEYHLPLAYQTRLDELLGIAKTRLDADAFAAAQMQGSALTLDAAIALAQATTG